jgi:hypothetical protein
MDLAHLKETYGLNILRMRRNRLLIRAIGSFLNYNFANQDPVSANIEIPICDRFYYLSSVYI